MKSLFEYTDYRLFLNDYYRARKAQHAIWSHRYIEGQLGLSAGYFSRIIRGEKNIGASVIARFCTLLKLNRRQSSFFEHLVKYNQAKDGESRAFFYERLLNNNPTPARELCKEHYSFFQEVHHVAVHALLHIRAVYRNDDFGAIGKLLLPPLPAAKVQSSIALLEKLALVRLTEQGRYELTTTILSAGTNPRDITLRRFLQESFERAARMVDTIPANQRTASVMTISISEQTYLHIKDRIEAFKQEVRDMIARDKEMNRVYQLGMHLMPLSTTIAPEAVLPHHQSSSPSMEPEKT